MSHVPSQSPTRPHPHPPILPPSSSPTMPGPPTIYYGPPPGHPGHPGHPGGPFSFAAPPSGGPRPLSANGSGDSAAQGPGPWANRQLPRPQMDFPGHPAHAARRMTYQPPPSEPMAEYQEWKSWRRDQVLPQTSPNAGGLPEGSFVDRDGGRYAEPALTHMQLPPPSAKTTAKRPRTESLLPSDVTQNGSSSLSRKKHTVQQDSPEYKPAYPAVLTREKKQKACSNCRKAKLKCIVEPNQTLCVRCHSRKEKCIFYPRGHDDDWQQTLQTDLYNATNHLSQLSNAVHHILHHLTASNLIPPLYPPYERYEAPDREGYFPPDKKGRDNDGDKKKRRKASRSAEEDEERPASPEPKAGVFLPPPSGPSGMFSYHQPPHTAPLPSAQIISPISARLGPTQQPFGLPMPLPTQAQGHAQGSDTIEQEKETPEEGPALGSPMNRGRSTLEGEYRGHQTGYPGQGHLTLSSMRDEPLPAIESEGMFVDENGLEIAVGSMDTRTDVIKKDIVSNKDALVLINYFHSRMSGFLYGYRLQLGHFPYLPEGPSTLTPLILAILCLVTCDHLPHLAHLRSPLQDEISSALNTSPAKSWQNFDATVSKDFGDLDGEDAIDAEFALGPEEIVGLCVVATWMVDRREAALIARVAFRWARGWIEVLKNQDRMMTVAEKVGIVPAERSATEQDMTRVWLFCYVVDSTERLRSPEAPQVTYRDALPNCNRLLPVATPPASHPVDPFDLLLTTHVKVIMILNEWRKQLGLLAEAVPEGSQSPMKRLVLKTNGDLEFWKANFDAVRPTGQRHGENAVLKWDYTLLTWLFTKLSVNMSLPDALAARPQTFPSYSDSALQLSPTQPQYQAHLPYASAAPQLSAADAQLREASLSKAADCAMQILEVCASWQPREELLYFSPTYLFFITLAAEELRRALGSLEERALIDAADVVALLRTIGESLTMGDLPPKHQTRMAAQALFYHAEQLEGPQENVWLMLGDQRQSRQGVGQA
ncbi:hypothetical protein I350_04990 [Cryptococcus amylolentus CBS 6273]|uniref:Zn(2)-C6 fungal-type domain-containing protein n=1 Tax=Cryptococcus amylolentus CBS 6273 TaxID=1296118 RepID=A0A1E3JYP1_9TREE|nr:hypothetical protein I350_04990 [Cryptococcus amylolentus CBS 6273]